MQDIDMNQIFIKSIKDILKRSPESMSK